MARIFENFETITMGDFVSFTRGYHVLTITGHKEETKTNSKGEIRDVDVFEITSDTGATTSFTLYYLPSTQWTYKKLLHSCGAKTDDMKGTQNVNFDKLIGKRFGAYVELEAVDKWDESKGMTVTRNYPRVNASKFYTEQRAIELMEKETQVAIAQVNQDVPNWDKREEMTPVDEGFVPF